MNGATEAFARVKIDALLRDAGWSLTDGASVLYEHALPDGTKADYVLCDRRGRPMAALEAKRANIDPIAAQDQGRHYAEQLGVPFVFLSNGEEVRFLVRDTDAHAREVAGFYAQDDLERRIAARRLRRNLSTVTIDRRIVDRDYQIDCIEENFPRILVSVNMLDTGFDCPEVVNLVMARFTQSAILYRQMRGRGTRRAPHIGKEDFTIFDFVGVTDFHGDDDTIIEGVLSVREQRSTYRATPRVLLTLDVDDHIDPESRDWLTLDEYGRIVRTPEHVARAAQIGVKFEAWRGEHGEFNAEQARWAGLLGSRVRADAMNMDAFGGWDFDEHPFAALGGYDQARRVFGGEESLDRLIAGFNVAVFGRRLAAGERRYRRRAARGALTSCR